MNTFSKLSDGEEISYSDQYFSGDFSHNIYIKKSNNDGSNKPKFYINIYTRINGNLVRQGYLYFYIDFSEKKSYFIGMNVEPEFRNLNIGSLLIANWIELCLNNGYDFLGIKNYIYKHDKKWDNELNKIDINIKTDSIITSIGEMRK